MSAPGNQSYIPTSIGDLGLNPEVEAIVAHFLQSRLHDSNEQLTAQASAWKAEEAVLCETIKALNEQIERTSISNLHDSPMPLYYSSNGTVLAESNRDDGTVSISGSRKRRRKTIGPVPDSAPARNTRSSRQASLFDATQAVLQPTIPAPLPSTAINDPTPPLFTFSNVAASQWPPNNQVSLPKRPAKVARKKKAIVKPAAEIHRFLPQEMPDDLGGLKAAMSLHLRVLWALLDAKEVPKNPPSELLKSFGNRFSSKEQLFSCQLSRVELIPRNLIQIGTAMSSKEGRIANQARLLEEHMLAYIHSVLARFGLYNWCPDLRQSAYSLYNAACRLVALDTFKQALISHAFIGLGPNVTYASRMDILIKLYDHFVFHYMGRRYRRENRQPGSVLQELTSTPMYQRRIRLAESRLVFLKANGYPRRYQNLINVKGTSDDERDPSENPPRYLIRHRRERSQKAEEFIRILDARREEQIKQDKSKKWRQRVRVVSSVPTQQDSKFQALPEGMPIDYFDPDFFNTLQPKTRNRIAIPKVALLPDMSEAFTWNADEHMSDKAFTQKYGAAVFAQYNVVSNADMANIVDGEDGDDGDDGDDEWAVHGDEDMPLADLDPTEIQSRNALSACLSGEVAAQTERVS